MADLRAAFNQHHALQCGFCTPGMLATARDIVLRLPDADDATIRHELSATCAAALAIWGSSPPSARYWTHAAMQPA